MHIQPNGGRLHTAIGIEMTCRHNISKNPKIEVCQLLCDALGWRHGFAAGFCERKCEAGPNPRTLDSPALQARLRTHLTLRVSHRWWWDETPTLAGKFRDSLPLAVRKLKDGVGAIEAGKAIVKGVRNGLNPELAEQFVREELPELL